MKVFISWSGSESQKVAKILKEWIPCVIQSIEPYFSSSDIDKGARWSTDIAKELEDASFGILCVTKDNLSSEWLNFEAGALSKSIDKSKVCPFLINLKPAEIQNSPILQFQMTTAEKDDVFKLFKSLNSNLKEKSIDEGVLKTTFDTFWPKILEDFKAITHTTEKMGDSKKNIQSNQIDEILELVRYQQRILNNPQELLPPDYLSHILRGSMKYNELHEFELASQKNIHRLSEKLCKILTVVIEEMDMNNMECMSKLYEAREIAERIVYHVTRKKIDRNF